jgi:hypothetical protein
VHVAVLLEPGDEELHPEAAVGVGAALLLLALVDQAQQDGLVLVVLGVPVALRPAFSASPGSSPVTATCRLYMPPRFGLRPFLVTPSKKLAPTFFAGKSSVPGVPKAGSVIAAMTLTNGQSYSVRRP